MKFVLGVALALCSTAANAYYSEEVGGVTWRYCVSGGVAILGSGNSSSPTTISTSTSGAVTIPEYLGGYEVAAIGLSAFRSCKYITSIRIPSGITEIQALAFKGCTALEGVDIPYGVRTIAESAFFGCTSLLKVSIPGSVNKIDAEAFSGCDHLISITLPSSLRELPFGLFNGCSRMTSAKLGSATTSIAKSVFGGCDRLRDIVIPKTLTTVNQDAFECKNLSTIFIDEGDEIRLSSLFVNSRAGVQLSVNYYCPNGGVVSTRIVEFEPCGPSRTGVLSLQSSKVVVNGESYGPLPEPGEYAGQAFQGWFTSPTGGSHVKSTSVVNLSGNQTLYAHWGNPVETFVVTFDPCGGSCAESKRDVDDGSAIGLLPTPAKTGYEFLGWFTASTGGTAVSQSFIVGRNMTVYAQWSPIVYRITYDVSGGTNNPTNPDHFTVEDAVTLESPTRAGYEFVGWTPNGGVIPKGSTGDRTFSANWKKLEAKFSTVENADGTVLITGLEGSYIPDCLELPGVVGNRLVVGVADRAFLQGSVFKKVKFPSSIQSIGYASFAECFSLKDVELAEGLRIIGGNAFCQTGISAIQIPSSVESIGDRAFMVCSNLTEVLVPDAVNSIGQRMFGGCVNLRKVTLPADITSIPRYSFYECENLEDFEIPTRVSEIGDYAFYGCKKIETLTFPATLTAIGENAFACCEGLKKIIVAFGTKSLIVQLLEASGFDVSAVEICEDASDLKVGQWYGTADSGLIQADCLDFFQAARSRHLPVAILVGQYICNPCRTILADIKKNWTYDLPVLLYEEYFIESYKFPRTREWATLMSWFSPTQWPALCFFWEKEDGSIVCEKRRLLGATRNYTAKFVRDNIVEMMACESSVFHTVSLDPRGGSMSTPELFVRHLSSLGECPTPTRHLSTFLGWFTDPVGGNEVDESTVITKDCTIYAHWADIPVTKVGASEEGAVTIELTKNEQQVIVSATPEYYPDFDEYEDWGVYYFKFTVKSGSAFRLTLKPSYATYDLYDPEWWWGIEFGEDYDYDLGANVIKVNSDYWHGESLGQNVTCYFRVDADIGDSIELGYQLVSSPDDNTEGAFTDIESLNVFGADSDVVKNITTEEELDDFNTFLSGAGVDSSLDISESQMTWAYQSFKLSEITTAPQLFEEEPVLKIDNIELSGDNLSLTISLTAGEEAIQLAKDKLAEKIRVGTTLGDITGKPTIVASPAADGTSLTFTITPPEGNQGFVRVRID